MTKRTVAGMLLVVLVAALAVLVTVLVMWQQQRQKTPDAATLDQRKKEAQDLRAAQEQIAALHEKTTQEFDKAEQELQTAKEKAVAALQAIRDVSDNLAAAETSAGKLGGQVNTIGELLVTSQSSAAEIQAELQRVQSEIQNQVSPATQALIQNIVNQIQVLRDNLQAAQDQVTQAQAEVTRLQTALAEAKANTEKAESEIQDLQAALDRAEKELQDAREAEKQEDAAQRAAAGRIYMPFSGGIWDSLGTSSQRTTLFSVKGNYVTRISAGDCQKRCKDRDDCDVYWIQNPTVPTESTCTGYSLKEALVGSVTFKADCDGTRQWPRGQGEIRARFLQAPGSATLQYPDRCPPPASGWGVIRETSSKFTSATVPDLQPYLMQKTSGSKDCLAEARTAGANAYTEWRGRCTLYQLPSSARGTLVGNREQVNIGESNYVSWGARLDYVQDPYSMQRWYK